MPYTELAQGLSGSQLQSQLARLQVQWYQSSSLARNAAQPEARGQGPWAWGGEDPRGGLAVPPILTPTHTTYKSPHVPKLELHKQISKPEETKTLTGLFKLTTSYPVGR